MAKDINIHLKTTGTERTKQQLSGVGKSAERVGDSTQQMGTKTSRAAGWMKSALSSLAGPLGFAGLAASAVMAIRKIIAAIDDMKKAVSEAVGNLAQQQRAAADLFEAFETWSPEQRKEVIALTRRVQTVTGIPFEGAKQILEMYKRAFGQLNEQAIEQLAGYWQLHAQEATPELIRWMGAEGIETPERQGAILRMISTVATESKLRDPELIRGILRYTTEFRQMGWSPEETIANVGKVMAGLSQAEARRAMGGLVEGIKTLTEEKALEMGAPAEVAVSERQRLEWARKRMVEMPLAEQTRFAQEAFGKTYAAYVTKFLVKPYKPEALEAVRYAVTPEAAEEERQRVFAVRKTAEGLAGQLDVLVSQQQAQEAAIRRVGEKYLNYLRYTDRVRYELIKAFPEEMEKEVAAEELWRTLMPPGKMVPQFLGQYGPTKEVEIKPSWRELPLEQRLIDLRMALQRLLEQAREQAAAQTRGEPAEVKLPAEPDEQKLLELRIALERLKRKQKQERERAAAKARAAEPEELETEEGPPPRGIPTETRAPEVQALHPAPVAGPAELELPERTVTVNHNYDNSIKYYPRVGDDLVGPRYTQI